jgi:hypothetical protein
VLSAHLLPAKRYSLGEHIAAEVGLRSRWVFLSKSNVHRWRPYDPARKPAAACIKHSQEPRHHKSLVGGRVRWRLGRIATVCTRRLGLLLLFTHRYLLARR